VTIGSAFAPDGTHKRSARAQIRFIDASLKLSSTVTNARFRTPGSASTNFRLACEFPHTGGDCVPAAQRAAIGVSTEGAQWLQS
jgi:hypothetical protein